MRFSVLGTLSTAIALRSVVMVLATTVTALPAVGELDASKASTLRYVNHVENGDLDTDGRPVDFGIVGGLETPDFGDVIYLGTSIGLVTLEFDHATGNVRIVEVAAAPLDLQRASLIWDPDRERLLAHHCGVWHEFARFDQFDVRLRYQRELQVPHASNTCSDQLLLSASGSLMFSVGSWFIDVFEVGVDGDFEFKETIEINNLSNIVHLEQTGRLIVSAGGSLMIWDGGVAAGESSISELEMGTEGVELIALSRNEERLYTFNRFGKSPGAFDLLGSSVPVLAPMSAETQVLSSGNPIGECNFAVVRPNGEAVDVLCRNSVQVSTFGERAIESDVRTGESGAPVEPTEDTVPEFGYVIDIAESLDGERVYMSTSDMGLVVLSRNQRNTENEAPDLVVEAPVVSDSEVTPGSVFSIDVSVRNQGDAASVATTLRYFQSEDQTISTEDEQLGSASVGALDTGNSSEQSIEVTAPNAVGKYYYGACVDAISDESDSSNNCSTSAQVQVAHDRSSTPDLEVISASVTDASPEMGTTFTFSVTVRNQGGVASGESTLRVYRSVNSIISTSDTNAGVISISSIASGVSTSHPIVLTAPSSVGVFYYGACVDEVANEWDITNNCSGGVRLAVGPDADSDTADLIVSEFSASEVNPDFGDLFAFTVEVKNDGTAGSSATSISFIQLGIDTLFGQDLIAASAEVPALESMETHTTTVHLLSPPLGIDRYYVVCVVTVIEELESENNCSDDIEISSMSTFAHQDQEDFNSRMVGKRIHAETLFIDFPSEGRFLESFRHTGDYSYTNTGTNTGTLVQTYDSGLFGGSCTQSLTWRTDFTGSTRYTCESGDESERETMYVTDLNVAPMPKLHALENVNTEIEIAFNERFEAAETKAFDYQIRRKHPRDDWVDICALTVNTLNDRVLITARLFVSGLLAGTTYEARYRFRNSASCEEGNPNPWSVIGEGATSGSLANNGLVFPDGSATSRTLRENAQAEIDVGKAVATLGGDDLVYSLRGTDSDKFKISSRSGQIRTKEGVYYDYETQSSYSLIVDVTNGTDTASTEVTVNLTDEDARCESIQGLVVDGADGAIRLRWNPIRSDSEHAEILGYETSVRELNGNWSDARRFVGSHIDGAVYSGLTNDQGYEARVRSFNSEEGCSWSGAVSATPNTTYTPANASQFFDRLGRRPLGPASHNLTFFSESRCRYINGETARDANCEYSSTDDSAATIDLVFDDPSFESCSVGLTYSSRTAGSFSDGCTDEEEDPTVNFDIAFRLADQDSGTAVTVPQSHEEFDEFVWNRADLIPGFGLGCMLGHGACDFLPDSRSAYRVELDASSNLREFHMGQFQYQNKSSTKGMLTFTEDAGRLWEFTLDIDHTGTVQTSIADSDAYASVWHGASHLVLASGAATLQTPIPTSWLRANSTRGDHAPDTIGDLTALIPGSNDDEEDSMHGLLERTLMGERFDMAYAGPSPTGLAHSMQYKKLGRNRAALTMVWVRGQNVALTDAQASLLGSTWSFDFDFVTKGVANLVTSVAKEGVEKTVSYELVDIAGGDQINLTEFPEEVVPPDEPPQSAGVDETGIQIGSATTIRSIDRGDLQTFIASIPSTSTHSYSPGEWLEPKDGGNQRMMIVRSEQSSASSSSFLSRMLGVGSTNDDSVRTQVLKVVCMQQEADLPTRGARYFSRAKAAETVVELCQRNCVLNDEEEIQGCVWDCETATNEASQAHINAHMVNPASSSPLVRDVSWIGRGKNLIARARKAELR